MIDIDNNELIQFNKALIIANSNLFVNYKYLFDEK